MSENFADVKGTDDQVVLALFDVVTKAPEDKKLEFYTRLSSAMNIFKRQNRGAKLSYNDVLAQMGANKCAIEGRKMRMVQAKLDRSKKKEDNYNGAVWGVIALSLEGAAGTAKASAATLDFIAQTLARTDETFLRAK